MCASNLNTATRAVLTAEDRCSLREAPSQPGQQHLQPHATRDAPAGSWGGRSHTSQGLCWWSFGSCTLSLMQMGQGGPYYSRHRSTLPPAVPVPTTDLWAQGCALSCNQQRALTGFIV